MKRILIALFFTCFVAIPSFAMVESGCQHDANLDLTYPLIYTDNPDAQKNINTDIANYVEDAKACYYNNAACRVMLKYDVKYEDDHVISIILTRLTDSGGAHPLQQFYGLVYDKDTGSRIPISNYVNIGSLEQWSHLAGTDRFPAYNEKNERISLMRPAARISEDYYLAGNGIFYMIYQPYEVSSHADGMVSIEFNPANIKDFNE